MLTLDQGIGQLYDANWPTVAEDLQDGTPTYVVLRRLSEIGEEESDAYEIVAAIEED